MPGTDITNVKTNDDVVHAAGYTDGQRIGRCGFYIVTEPRLLYEKERFGSFTDEVVTCLMCLAQT